MSVHRRWAEPAILVATLGVSSLASAVPVSGQGTWQATLQGRDLDGNLATAEAYFDTALGITWLADANHAAGRMDWYEANAWVGSLDFNGIDDWRLPTWTDTGAPDCNHTYSGTDCGFNVDTASGEMAHLFYTTLGNLAYYDTSGAYPQPGWGLSNTGPFANIPTSYVHWTSGTPANVYSAIYFHFGTGEQYAAAKTALGDAADQYAWAVHSGDVGAVVPTPDADGDGVPDAQDNCPYAANPAQSDVGGLGTGSPSNAVGDACECGDVTGDGRVTIADAVVISRSLLDPPTASRTRPELCDVGGSPNPATQDCSLADAVIVRRALLNPPTASIQAVCAPAHP